MVRRATGKYILAKITRVAFAASVYYTSQECNLVVSQRRCFSASRVIARVLMIIKLRLMGNRDRKNDR